jgi:3-hydroxyacyl-CoA dehydrogenase/enoyl-CoA hydratase/3-hydroxybutyryl-CoA epimerase/enoyl-CoA isomerase
MGGGIAYQAAYKGTPIIMKDIRMKHWIWVWAKRLNCCPSKLKEGRMTPADMG